MLHIRIDKTVYDILGKLLKLCFRQVEGLYELIEHHLVDELADFRVFHTFLHCVEP